MHHLGEGAAYSRMDQGRMCGLGMPWAGDKDTWPEDTGARWTGQGENTGLGWGGSARLSSGD